jgi:hypothetical protein
MNKITLTEEKTQVLENLAALGYSPHQMAEYLAIDPVAFQLESTDPESKVSYHIRHGVLMATAKEQLKILADAQSGNVTASQQLASIRRTKAWELSRKDIFAGFNDKKLLTKLEDYLEGGCKMPISNEEAIYIDALTLFNSMGRKYGRRNTVNFFTKEPWNLRYNRASEMYDEAIRLFYTDRNIEKKAIRNKYAEEIEEASIVVRDNAVTSKDWEIYASMVMNAAKLRELDKPDPEMVPSELYLKPIRLYSLDPTDIGLPKTNRAAVAAQIEALDIPERDKLRISQDAMIETFNIAEKLNDLEEESKSEQ